MCCSSYPSPVPRHNSLPEVTMPLHGFSHARAVRILRTAFIAIVVLAGLIGPMIRVEAAPIGQSGTVGETIFQTKCAACHSIGGGKLVGPDLQGGHDQTRSGLAQGLHRGAGQGAGVRRPDCSPTAERVQQHPDAEPGIDCAGGGCADRLSSDQGRLSPGRCRPGVRPPRQSSLRRQSRPTGALSRASCCSLAIRGSPGAGPLASPAIRWKGSPRWAAARWGRI